MPLSCPNTKETCSQTLPQSSYLCLMIVAESQRGPGRHEDEECACPGVLPPTGGERPHHEGEAATVGGAEWLWQLGPSSEPLRVTHVLSAVVRCGRQPEWVEAR